jgi:predicted Mrr-cat superfamily restriction endonuclease
MTGMGTIRIWRISPGKGAYQWYNGSWEEQSVIAVGFCDEKNLGNLEKYNSEESLREKIAKFPEFKRPGYNANQLWVFTNEIKRHDIVVAYGSYKILDIGIVNDEKYTLEKDQLYSDWELYGYRKSVEWLGLGPITLKSKKIKDFMKKNATVFEVDHKDTKDLIMNILKKVPGYKPGNSAPDLLPGIAVEELRTIQKEYESVRLSKRKYFNSIEKIRKQFVKKFSVHKIKALGIDDFVEGKILGGKPNTDTFCYWVEWKTENLGRMQGATAYKFGLFFDKKTQKYRFTKRFKNKNEALNSIKENILKLIELGKNKDLDEIIKVPISPMFKGKILFLYYPNNFLNIFSDSHIDHFLKQIGLYYGNKDMELVYKRELLLYWKKNDIVMKKWTPYEFMDFLYRAFPPQEDTDKLPKKSNGHDFKFPDADKVIPKFRNEPKIKKTKTDKGKETSKKRKKSGEPNYEAEYKSRKKLGDYGEWIVYYNEKRFLKGKGRKDLARKVKKVKDDSLGYDVLSYDLNEKRKYIEVKSTRRRFSNEQTFFITPNEIEKGKELKNHFLYIVNGAGTDELEITPIKKPFPRLYNKGIFLEPRIFAAKYTID